MASVFLTGVGVSAGVVCVFSKPVEGVLERVIAEEMTAAWTKYAKFALFVAALGATLIRSGTGKGPEVAKVET